MAFDETHNGTNGNGQAHPFDAVLRNLEARYEARINHVDQRVGRVEQGIASINSTLEGLERVLSDVSRKVHNPPQTQWGAIIAFASLVLTAAMAYTTLTIGPVQRSVDTLATKQEGYRSQELIRIEEYGQSSGEYRARITRLEADLNRTSTALEATEKRLDELNYRLGYAEGQHAPVRNPP